jgi:hypothetical protein
VFSAGRSTHVCAVASFLTQDRSVVQQHPVMVASRSTAAHRRIEDLPAVLLREACQPARDSERSADPTTHGTRIVNGDDTRVRRARSPPQALPVRR